MRSSVAIAAVLLLGACGAGASVGESCAVGSDCEGELQCLLGTCTPRCHTHAECGDGFVCEAPGSCREVQSDIGEPCQRELECGPGQACTLDADDVNRDGVLGATCQPNLTGSGDAALCQDDTDCRNGLCSLGHCTALCVSDEDCPLQLACNTIPRPLDDGSAPRFSGCMQRGGVLEVEYRMDSPLEELEIPVPETARSFAVVATLDDESLLVGADRVIAPDDELLYQRPLFAEEFYTNRIRHAPTPVVSTLLVPNTPSVGLLLGVYRVTVGSFTAQGNPGSGVPRVTVFYKLDSARRLDLHLYFLDLAGHPCEGALDVAGLDATTAAASPAFQGEYLAHLRVLIESAGLAVGEITYTDITDRPELDGLSREDIGRLVRLSTAPSGVSVFFVRSIEPEGIQALVSGAPGPPMVPGTISSGVALSLDSICYRSWESVARLTAHAIGRQIGLYRNLEPDGYTDPIPDSDTSPDNLLFFSEFGGDQLSDGQRVVLSLYPGLR